MKDSNNTGKMIGALLIGAAIGGVLGVLFAPDKGSETRKKLADKGGDLTDSMKKILTSILEEKKEELDENDKAIAGDYADGV
jgi:gas vesicle protein